MNGEQNIQNSNAIEFYGQIPILATFPKLEELSSDTLQNVGFPQRLKQILEIK